MIYKRDIAPALSDCNGVGQTDNSSNKLTLINGAGEGRWQVLGSQRTRESNPQIPDYQPGKHGHGLPRRGRRRIGSIPGGYKKHNIYQRQMTT